MLRASSTAERRRWLSSLRLHRKSLIDTRLGKTFANNKDTLVFVNEEGNEYYNTNMKVNALEPSVFSTPPNTMIPDG
jgi:hypothetical protein